MQGEPKSTVVRPDVQHNHLRMYRPPSKSVLRSPDRALRRPSPQVSRLLVCHRHRTLISHHRLQHYCHLVVFVIQWRTFIRYGVGSH